MLPLTGLVLFELFEAEYGFALQAHLPFLFEGTLNAAADIRVKFYELVGKIIARNYTKQLSDWCRAQGGKFSGHYLSEEYMSSHVKDYGSYVEVLKASDIPGIDVLFCYPEIYDYNTVKFPQMVARKKGVPNMMVEVCPFYNIETFNKDPIENIMGVMGLLYLGGVRIAHSYFAADYTEYGFTDMKGYMNKAEANKYNEYVSRLGYMLDGLVDDCNTFLYYGIEDVQGKTRPAHSSADGPEREADQRTKHIGRRIYEAGFNFLYADGADIAEAANSLKSGGTALISGICVKTIIIPGIDVIKGEALVALDKLQNAGVNVLFLAKLPQLGLDLQEDISTHINPFKVSSEEDILTHLRKCENIFCAEGASILKARYNKFGQEMWFVLNNSRENARVHFEHKEKSEANLYNPADGNVSKIEMGSTVEVLSFRGVFLVFE